MTQQELQKLNARKEVFVRRCGKNKVIHLTMVTSYGLKHNACSGNIQSEVTLSDLFAE